MEPEVRNKLDLAVEIRDVYAREILDFAGNPAIEVEVLAGGEIIGKASVAGKIIIKRADRKTADGYRRKNRIA